MHTSHSTTNPKATNVPETICFSKTDKVKHKHARNAQVPIQTQSQFPVGWFGHGHHHRIIGIGNKQAFSASVLCHTIGLIGQRCFTIPVRSGTTALAAVLEQHLSGRLLWNQQGSRRSISTKHDRIEGNTRRGSGSFPAIALTTATTPTAGRVLRRR